MTPNLDADYVPGHPRSKNANGATIAKSEPAPCALCEIPTRAHCPVCSRRTCAVCSLRDDRHRCPGCA
jgi:hypothetical protein